MHRYCFVLILFFLIVSCDKKVPQQEVSELQLENDINDETATLIGDPARGKAIYYLNCIFLEYLLFYYLNYHLR